VIRERQRGIDRARTEQIGSHQGVKTLGGDRRRERDGETRNGKEPETKRKLQRETETEWETEIGSFIHMQLKQPYYFISIISVGFQC
jgi:hypothetical protein